MKKLLLMIGTCVLIAAGCEDKLNLDSIPLGTEFELPKGEAATIEGVNSKLVVEIENIYDSRCPANAICIWEGNYGVDLKISDATQSTPVSLCNLFCGSSYRAKDTATFVLNEQEYKIILRDLQPYPGTTEQDTPKIVLLEILK